jgi:hypothetical protein
MFGKANEPCGYKSLVQNKPHSSSLYNHGLNVSAQRWKKKEGSLLSLPQEASQYGACDF